jgi:hypothetical protein
MNHKIGISPIKDLTTLVDYLCQNEVVYFAPAGKVMPTKFFVGWSWSKSGAILKHLESGSFCSAKSYSKMMRSQIRGALLECPEIINKRVA